MTEVVLQGLGRKMVFSVDGAGPIGQPNGRNKSWYPPHNIHKQRSQMGYRSKCKLWNSNASKRNIKKKNLHNSVVGKDFLNSTQKVIIIKGKHEKEIQNKSFKLDVFPIHVFIQWPIHHLMNKPHRSTRKRQHNRKTITRGSWRLRIRGDFSKIGKRRRDHKISSPDYYPTHPPQARACPGGVRE